MASFRCPPLQVNSLFWVLALTSNPVACFRDDLLQLITITGRTPRVSVYPRDGRDLHTRLGLIRRSPDVCVILVRPFFPEAITTDMRPVSLRTTSKVVRNVSRLVDIDCHGIELCRDVSFRRATTPVHAHQLVLSNRFER